ncbi:MAG: cytochrome P460 family protein, partial [Pirellulales bacterium]
MNVFIKVPVNARLLPQSLAIVAILLGIAGSYHWLAGAAAAPAEPTSRVEFTSDGKLKQPTGYREWMYVGTPLTPNDLNGGEAPFPEFHAVYIDPDSFAHYQQTGEFRDGTVMVKEL